MVFLFLFGFFLVSAAEENGSLKRSKSEISLPFAASFPKYAPSRQNFNGEVFISQDKNLQWRTDKKGNAWLLEKLIFDKDGNVAVTLPSLGGALGELSCKSLPEDKKKAKFTYSGGPVYLYKINKERYQAIPVADKNEKGLAYYFKADDTRFLYMHKSATSYSLMEKED